MRQKLREILPVIAVLSAAFLGPAGCGRSPDFPLPPEDDLYAYSLAVAEKAELKIRRGRYLARYNVAKVHERFGIEERAIETYREAAKLQDNAFDAYRDIGFILSQRSDRMDEAVEAYRQAIRCDPAQSGIWTRIGLIFIHQSRLEEAVEALRNEIAGGGASENTYCSLGMAYQLQERHEEAVESFSRAPELRGRLSTGWRSR